jgi:Protein of unknown function (DUF1329)
MAEFKMTWLVAALLIVQLGGLHAAVTPDEAKALGSTLTLVGAEKAGSADGAIPAYTGGLTTAPANFDKTKNVRPDPFADEKPLFSIDAKNMGQYADKLTAGTNALLKSVPGYRIDVYPTHRTAAYPPSVLDNTVKNATRANMDADGVSMRGGIAGIPFPIPGSGPEVMENFLARFNGNSFLVPKFSAYNVDSAGKLVLSAQGSFLLESVYYDSSKSGDSRLLNRTRINYSGPARRAGEAIMSLEPVDYSDRGRRAWQYLPGQRRVRLAPDLAYDTPNSSTAGMSTYDDVNLFNGKMDRFDFRLVGKKEIYIPYNTYRFTYAADPAKVFLPKAVNPDVLRWELHRVWVVEAKLKDGQRHIYSRRTFYVDEDSWAAVASDEYDGRGQLWRAGYSYLTQSYDVPVPTTVTSGQYDLIAGTYYMNIWPGASGIKISETYLPDAYWTGDSLAGQGVR